MNKSNKKNKFISIINDENIGFLAGLLVFTLSVFLAVAFISFFSTGMNDFSLVNGSPAADAGSLQAQNPAGRQGARFADFIVNDGFGVASFFLIAALCLIGIKLMKIGKLNYAKWIASCLLSTIWTSVFISTLFYKNYKDNFISYGGKHGELISQWLIRQIGNVGTWLLLFISFVAIMAFISANAIPRLKKLLLFNRRKLKKGKLQTNEQTETTNAAENETEETDILDNEEYPAKHPEPNVEHYKPSNEENNTSLQVDGMTIEVVKDDEEEVFNERTIDLEQTEPYDPRRDLEYYKFPTIDLLEQHDNNDFSVNKVEITANKDKITEVLHSFGIDISNIKATVGPTITLYEITPAQGVRISKIRGLEDDIALNLKSEGGVRIIAPMPGKGTIGIEVPNTNKKIVSMRSIIASKKFQETAFDLPIALGRTITNEVFIVDLAKMPHILVAGATGQGKSVGLNVIITSLIYKKHPAELKFVMVDPKKVEFSMYSIIEKHFLAKLPDSQDAIITDVTKVQHTLNSLCIEMDERYDLLKAAQVRNLQEYNKKFVSRQLNPEKGHKFMPYIVVVIDEFSDLILQAGKEIEMPIIRIAQLARAVGIHMIIATQRPSADVITGRIKTNFGARIAFKVPESRNSMVILDRPGANHLIGNGDMLFLHNNDPVRVQCPFVSTKEVENITSFVASQQAYPSAFYLPEYSGESDGKGGSNDMEMGKKDPLFEEAARLVVYNQSGSTSLIQRKFSIGYNRAGRIMDQLERAGIVGAADSSKPRQVLCMDEMDLQNKLDNMK